MSTGLVNTSKWDTFPKCDTHDFDQLRTDNREDARSMCPSFYRIATDLPTIAPYSCFATPSTPNLPTGHISRGAHCRIRLLLTKMKKTQTKMRFGSESLHFLNTLDSRITPTPIPTNKAQTRKPTIHGRVASAAVAHPCQMPVKLKAANTPMARETCKFMPSRSARSLLGPYPNDRRKVSAPACQWVRQKLVSEDASNGCQNKALGHMRWKKVCILSSPS